ncbi:MAG: hypothetical protein Q7S21_03535 [archaeon]|nr:hypothetical protein [archaeon]
MPEGKQPDPEKLRASRERFNALEIRRKKEAKEKKVLEVIRGLKDAIPVIEEAAKKILTPKEVRNFHKFGVLETYEYYKHGLGGRKPDKVINFISNEMANKLSHGVHLNAQGKLVHTDHPAQVCVAIATFIINGHKVHSAYFINASRIKAESKIF